MARHPVARSIGETAAASAMRAAVEATTGAMRVEIEAITGAMRVEIGGGGGLSAL